MTDISVFARPSKGVRVMKLTDGERVVSVTPAQTDNGDEDDTDADTDAAEKMTPKTESGREKTCQSGYFLLL